MSLMITGLRVVPGSGSSDFLGRSPHFECISELVVPRHTMISPKRLEGVSIMKQSTPGMSTSATYAGELSNARRMLRRDLSLRHSPKLPDFSKAKNMAEQLEILERYVAQLPAVDPHVRSTIRNAIATGNYTIDPVSIAGKFLKFEEELYS